MTDKIREEFERTNARDHRRQPPKGNNYIDPMAQADWDSFQKGWMQSRAAMVVDLPKGGSMWDDEPVEIKRSDAVAAIEAAGGSVMILRKTHYVECQCGEEEGRCTCGTLCGREIEHPDTTGTKRYVSCKHCLRMMPKPSAEVSP